MKKAALLFAAAAAAVLILFGGEKGLDRAAKTIEDGIEQNEVAAFIFGVSGETFV
ncbi:MAG: hypothetical protein IJV00_00700 [Clostridia bacterium]|nr:hypothetical protein [Clostridia bacterium]